jgi:hypothetical protein
VRDLRSARLLLFACSPACAIAKRHGSDRAAVLRFTAGRAAKQSDLQASLVGCGDLTAVCGQSCFDNAAAILALGGPLLLRAARRGWLEWLTPEARWFS